MEWDLIGNGVLINGLQFRVGPYKRREAPGGSGGKEPPAVQETWVRSLGGKDPLEKGMATHSSILAWRIPWTGEPGGLESMQLQRVRHA